MIGIKRHWQGVTLSTDCYFLYRRMFITNNFITAWCIARNMLSQDALWRYWLIVPRCVSIRVFTVLCHKTSLRHKLNYHIMWDKDILLDKALTSDCTRALRARAAPRHWMKVKTQELRLAVDWQAIDHARSIRRLPIVTCRLYFKTSWLCLSPTDQTRF